MAKIKANSVIKKQAEKPELVIARIYEQSNYRIRQDINTWRDAITAGENVFYPNRVALYTLYDEIILDAHVQGVLQQRIENILSQQFRIVNEAGEDLPDATKIFQRKWFYDFLTLAIEAKPYGHSLIQLWEADPLTGYGEIELVPRRNVVPEKGLVTLWQGVNSSNVPYRDAPYWDYLIEVGGKKDFGLFVKIAPSFIVKKNALLQWSQYTEIFGAPMRVGKTTSRTQADMERMGSNLKNMGSMAYGVFQEGESIEFIESTKGDAYQVYLALLKYCDEQISKAMIGQTMTTDNGSSKSQSEVHERVADNITESDKRMISFVINDTLIPKMIQHGFKLTGAKFVWSPQKDMQALFNNVVALMPYVNVPADFIEENFGIPTEEKPQPEITPPVDDPANPPVPEKKPKAKKKVGLSIEQKTELLERASIVNLHHQLKVLYLNHQH